jgi:hypothetical protein
MPHAEKNILQGMGCKMLMPWKKKEEVKLRH